jgi:ubiquinone/menaquinone biosynthesis C-methylase UbiE
MSKKFNPLFSIQRNRVLLLKKNRTPEKVLELGCGNGDNSKFVKNLFPDVEYYGMDVLENHQVSSAVIYKKINLEEDLFPFPDNYFDFIVFTHVIEHLKNPFRIGNEINRVLKNDGRIYIETPNWTSMLVPSFGFKREQHYPFNFFDEPTHIRPWTKHSLFEYVSESCKLNVSKVGTVRNWIRLPFDLFLIVYGILSGKRWRIISSFWNIYGWSIYIVGIKK